VNAGDLRTVLAGLTIAAPFLLGCGSRAPSPLKTNATNPQHENVERFLSIWKKKPFNQVTAADIKALVPIGLERSRFQDALSTAVAVKRSNEKTYFLYGEEELKREGECQLAIVVDDKSDKIVQVFIVAAHN